MSFDLTQYGITVSKVFRNASPAQLYEDALKYESAAISSAGALMNLSGKKTGRSPKDKRVVRNPESENDIWWGSVNIEMPDAAFLQNRSRAIDYLNTRDHLYVVDAFGGWDKEITKVETDAVYKAVYESIAGGDDSESDSSEEEPSEIPVSSISSEISSEDSSEVSSETESSETESSDSAEESSSSASVPSLDSSSQTGAGSAKKGGCGGTVGAAHGGLLAVCALGVQAGIFLRKKERRRRKR